MKDKDLEILRTDSDPNNRREAAKRLFARHEKKPLGAATLEKVAEIAQELGDVETHRRALELLTKDKDAKVRARASVSLGDLYVDLGDRKKALDSWRPAAATIDAGDAAARQLYERVLDTLPNDRDAAEKLVEIYSHAGEWDKVPEVFGVVLRADREVGAELALRLQDRATDPKARERFLALLDEASALQASASATARRLQLARARTLAKDPARAAEASTTYRSLVDMFEHEDDAREYLLFIEDTPALRGEPWVQRWLYEWRSKHDERPFDVLQEWAKFEKEAGEPEQGARVTQRMLEIAPEADKPRVALELVGLLDELRRHKEAAKHLAPLLTAPKRMTAAHEILRIMLADRGGPAVVDVLEGLANEASESDPRTAARLYLALAQAAEASDDVPGSAEARRRWLRTALELPDGPGVVGLVTILDAALDTPEDTFLWETAERLGRERGELEAVVSAYAEILSHDPFAQSGMSPGFREPVASSSERPLTERLGERMIALEGESAVAPAVFVDALLAVLERVPTARWALDRVKLALGTDARWQELFHIYDAALDATEDVDARVELLREAGVAARDLASDTTRAIRYFEAARALRRDDDIAIDALARLFAREGRKEDLVRLLEGRVASLSGPARHAQERRIATTLLELGKLEEAGITLERSIADGANVSDVVESLERVARDRSGARARARLGMHYERLGRHADIVRLLEIALGFASDEGATPIVRELVRVHLRIHKAEAARFARVIPAVEKEIAGRPKLVLGAFRAILVRTIRARRRAKTDAEWDDALRGSAIAVDRIHAFHLEAENPRAAARVLLRASRLPFARGQQRALLEMSALLSSESSSPLDQPRALKTLHELFANEGEGDTPVRAELVERYVHLLEASLDRAKLVAFLEQQARVHERRGEHEAAGGCWARAGAIWEERAQPDRALAAYVAGAAASSEPALEALARLHASEKRWSEARAAIERLLALPSSTGAVRARRTLLLADALVGGGASDDFDRAIALLEATIEEAAGSEPEIALEARVRLIAIYRARGALRELADTLAAQASALATRAVDAAQRLALLDEASRVFDEQLDAPDDAIALLERAVRKTPEDLGVRPLLARLLERRERWPRVVEVLEAQVVLYGDRRSKERALVHHRLGTALAKCTNAEVALVHFEAAAKMHPAHPEILYDLARAALAADDLNLAERTYRALLLAKSSSTSSARIFLDLADIAKRKGEAPRSADLLESGLEAAVTEGADPLPFEAALRELQRYDLLARAVEARFDRASDTASRAMALRDLADLWGGELEMEAELGARVRHHAEALCATIDHADKAAWPAVWGVAVSLGDPLTLASLVRKHLDASPNGFGGDDAPWLREAADVVRGLGDEALELEIYEALARAAPNDDASWTALESALERRGETARVVPLLERSIEGCTDPKERASLRKRLAQRLPTSAALAQLAEAAVEDPTDEPIAELYTSLLDAEGRHADLAIALERRLAALGRDPAANPATGLALAGALERADRKNDAMRLYERMLDAGPPDVATARAIAGRLDALGSRRLADALEAWIERDADSLSLLAPRLLDLRDAQGDAAATLRALKLARSEDPTDDVLLRRLVDAHRKAGDGQEALRLVDDAITRAAGRPARFDLRCLRAEMLAESGQGALAAAELRAIEAPDGASVDRLVEVVEGMRKRAGDGGRELTLALVDVLRGAGRTPAARAELARVIEETPSDVSALELLAAMDEATEAWSDAVDARQRIVAALEALEVEGSAELRSAFLALARACDRAGRFDEGRDALARAAAAFPDDEEIVRALEQACEKSGAFAELADLFVARAEREDDPSEQAALFVRAAGLVEGEHATSLLERAREADPANVAAAVAVASNRIASKRHAEAVAVLEDITKRHEGKRTRGLAAVQLLLAKTHLAADALLEGFDALRLATSLEPRDPEAMLLFGLVAIDLSDEKTAERALLNVISLKRQGGSQDVVVAAYHLASMAFTNGDMARARRWVDKAVSEDPTHRAVLTLKARVEAVMPKRPGR